MLGAICGLLLAAMFRIVVVMHFILWNWLVVIDEDNWLMLLSVFPGSNIYTGPSRPVYAPRGSFLAQYRTTAKGFPIMQAAIQPVALVLACTFVLISKCASNHLPRRTLQQATATEMEVVQIRQEPA